MKNITIIFTVLLTIFSCSKENLISNLSFSKTLSLEDKIEIERLYDIYTNKDYDNGFIAGSNYGLTVPPSQININGKVPTDFSIIIDKQTIKPSGEGDREGMIYHANNNYQNFFGREISFKLKDSKLEVDYNVYVPKILTVTPIYKIENGNPTNNIDRINNTFTWVEDDKSLGVLIQYGLFDRPESEEGAKLINSGYKILEDNGSYSLDDLIKNTDIKYISISFKRANAVNFTTKDAKNVMFSFQTIDHHAYLIK